MLKALLWLGAIGWCAHWFVPKALQVAARTRSREVFLLAVFASCLLVAIATAWCGLSLALGAFLAGLVLAESEHHYQVRSEVEPLRDTLASLFFVSIGMLFDPHVLVTDPCLVVAALAAVVCGKALIVLPIAKLVGYPAWIATRSAFLLAQVGEFSFVLVQLARDRQILGTQLERVFLVVAALSIAATPLWSALGSLLAKKRREFAPEGAAETTKDHVVLIGYGTTGQAVGRGLEALRIPFVAIDLDAQHLAVARTLHARLIVGDATHPQVLEAAGLARARLAVIALDDSEATRRAVARCRRIAPDTRLVVRTSFLSEVEQLFDLGVRQVVPQELEASVEVLVRALRHYLVPDDEVGRQVKALRQRAFGIEKAATPAPSHGDSLHELLPDVALEILTVEPGSECAGRSLEDLGLPARTGCTIVAVRRTGRVMLGLGPEVCLLAADTVVLLGASERIHEAAAMLRSPSPQVVN